MFGILVTLVLFGLMLAVVAAGFRSSERAVNTTDTMRRERDGVRQEAAAIRTP